MFNVCANIIEGNNDMKKNIIIIVLILTFFILSGCKKSSSQNEPNAASEMNVPTEQQYREQAQQEITEENIDEEFQKLKAEIESDIQNEQPQ